MTSAALEAKDKGNEAFSKGDYVSAIRHYTEAIENDKQNATESLHLFYSNRSACYLSLNEFKKAIDDGQMCIEKKPSWGKGYSRKGAALFRLGKYNEAVAIYKKGLEVDPTNEALQNGLEGAKVAAKSIVTLRSFVLGDRKAIHRTLQFILRCIMLFTFITYLIPFASPMHYANVYSRFFKAVCINYLIHILQTHGMIKFKLEYAAGVLQDGTTQYLLFALTMFGTLPSLICMAPFMVGEIPHLASYSCGLLRIISPPLFARTALLCDQHIPRYIQNPRWSMMTTDAKWKEFNDQTLLQMAYLDILVGITLVLELFTPHRNFIMLFCYFQLLKLRYVTSTHTQKAVHLFDTTILRLVHHPKTPSLLNRGYNKLRGFVIRMGQVPQPGENAERPKCTIM